jgi:hypothetical protein
MKRLLFYFSTLVISFLTLTTCFDNGGEEIKTSEEIILKTKTFETYLHLEFTDAKTNESLRGKDVTLVVKGKDAESVYNNLGVKESAYTTKAGFYDLMVDQSKATGDFVVNISSAGYENYIYHIRLQNPTFNTFSAKLIKTDDLPEGISVADPETFTTNAEGKTTKNVEITVDNSNSIRLQEGVVLKDAEGKVLTGEIKSKVAFYDPRKTVEFFPGGLDVEAILDDGQNSNITFASAGLFAIDLTAGNTPVKTIDGGIELTTIIDTELVNPNTGNPVAEGDEIQLWSMDAETAVWKKEKTTTVKKNATGQLYLSESINHLSYWNWDWFYNSCPYGVTIKWGGNANGVNVKITNRTPLDSYHSQVTVRVDVNDPYSNSLQFQNVPRNTPMTLSFEGACGSNLTILPPTIVIPNMCEQREIPVQVIKQQSPTSSTYTVNLDVNVSKKSDPNVRLTFDAWAYFYSNCTYASQYSYINDGRLTAQLEAGSDYYFDLSLARAYGYGYFRVDEIAGNKVRVRFSPEYAYTYDANWNYSNPTIPREEIILDKPANKIINIVTNFKIDDDLLSTFYYY